MLTKLNPVGEVEPTNHAWESESYGTEEQLHVGQVVARGALGSSRRAMGHPKKGTDH